MLTLMTGHVFALRGDLTRLACDALVLPCDAWLNISDVWGGLFSDDLPAGDAPAWIRLPGEADADGIVDLGTIGTRRLAAVVTTHSDTDEPSSLADRLLAGVRTIATKTEPHQGRTMPLVALPLVGTGEGGLAHRRGEVIDELLPRLEQAASSADIAVVLKDRRDFAAVQRRRHAQTWKPLTEKQLELADHLGRLAANGELSLFLGAGVSRPAGLPDWWTLLSQLARVAGGPGHWPAEADPLSAASELKEALGDEFDGAIAERLDVEQHALGHALLAGLDVHQMVTTNFDPCMETALTSTGRDFRVLTRNLADSSKPWLLKLHGDVRQPGSLILTAEDYQRHKLEHEAVRGVVQSLMLTSHLLFVGFSMIDQNFLEMADAVERVRAQAESGTGDGAAATALDLTGTGVAHPGMHALEVATMVPGGDVLDGSRVLEIFLDRLAWSAATSHALSAEYLLDDRYASGLSSADGELRLALDRLIHDTQAGRARASGAWPLVADLLRKLGSPEDAL